MIKKAPKDKMIRENQDKTPVCLNCHKKMKLVVDEMQKKITGHLWECNCMLGKVASR